MSESVLGLSDLRIICIKTHRAMYLVGNIVDEEQEKKRIKKANQIAFLRTIVNLKEEDMSICLKHKLY